MKVAVPILEKEFNGKKLINPHFGKSTLFAIVDLQTDSIKTRENPGLHVERGRGIYIAEMFKEEGVNAVLVKEMGPGAFDKIRNGLQIKVYLIPPELKFLDEALRFFKEGKLSELLEPNEDEHSH